MSEEKKTVIQVTDPLLLGIGITKIPVIIRDPINIPLPNNKEKIRSNNPYSEKKVSQ